MSTIDNALPTAVLPAPLPPRGKPFYANLWVQVLAAIALALVLGYFDPARAIAMKPLGDAFIRLITMVITLIIFCTVVSGIAGVQDIKKVGRVGGKALLYFEVVSTVGLLIGLVVGNVVKPGTGFNIDPASLDAKAIAEYAGQAKAQGVTEFLMHIIPTTVVNAFATGDILQVLLVSILFGFALSAVGARAKPLLDLLESLTRAVFKVVNIVMRFAPLGAFGAMAFTIGKYGFAALGPLLRLILVFYRHLHWLHRHRARRNRRSRWIWNIQIPGLHPRRDPDCLGRKRFGSGIAYLDGKARAVGMLAAPRRPGRPLGIYLQYRWHRLVHDARGSLRGTSDQHASYADAATDHFRGRHADIKRCQRRARRLVHRSHRYSYGRTRNSCGQHGPAARHRPVYEHGPRPGQHDW